MRRFLVGIVVALAAISFVACSSGGGGETTDSVLVNTLDGAADVARDSTFLYNFAQSTVTATVLDSSYFIVPTPAVAAHVAKAAIEDTICDSANALSAVINCSTFTQCTLAPAADLAGGTSYTICLTTDILYTDGTNFEGFMAQFTTAGGGGGTVTAMLSPVDSATEVALDAAVTALFSGAITEPADWAAAFTLKKDNTGDSLCTGVTYDSSTLTAMCAHAALDKGSSYTTSVSGVTDAGGGTIDAATATFATKEAVVVSSINLVRKDSTVMDTTDRPIPRSVKIKYTLATALTEEAQRTEFEAAVTVTDPGETEVAGTYVWATDYLSTTFTPTRNLEFKTQYTITVNTDGLPVVNLSKAVGTETTFTTLMPRDINGDGYDDVIVGASGYDPAHLGGSIGRAYIYRGLEEGPSTTASTTITGVAIDNFLGWSVGMAGDVNGDGYIDVIVGSKFASDDKGQAYLFLGSASGITSCDIGAGCEPDAIITGSAALAFLGESVGFAGDVNGDGYDDIIVGEKDVSNHKGKAYVMLGSVGGINTCDLSDGCEADTTLIGSADGALFGTSVSTAGDVDGDGYDDVIVGAIGSGSTHIFLGSDTGVEDCDLSGGCTPNATIIAEDVISDQLGMSVSTVGDINGDGYADVIVGATQASGGAGKEGKAYVFKGSMGGIGDCNLSGACDNLLSTIIGASADDGLGTVYTAGDVDGDGTPDIIIGASAAEVGGNHPGQAYVFLGSALTAAMTPADASATFTGNADVVLFGGLNGVSTAGDVNGDGYDDVIVGAINAPVPATHWGQAYIFNGSATGPATCDLSDACAADTTFGEDDYGDCLGTVR